MKYYHLPLFNLSVTPLFLLSLYSFLFFFYHSGPANSQRGGQAGTGWPDSGLIFVTLPIERLAAAALHLRHPASVAHRTVPRLSWRRTPWNHNEAAPVGEGACKQIDGLQSS